MQQQSKELQKNDNPRPQTVIRIKQPEGGRNQNNGRIEHSADMESQVDEDAVKKSNKAYSDMLSRLKQNERLRKVAHERRDEANYNRHKCPLLNKGILQCN